MIRLCNNFDIETHGCVPHGEGFKCTYNVNECGDCLSPGGGGCEYYCDDADRVFYSEEDFVKAFFKNNPLGYTSEDLLLLYSRIPYDMSHKWIQSLVEQDRREEGYRFTVAYKPLDELPLYINKPLEPFFKLFLEWRLEIGK
jgi:hypothetical protein